LVVGQAIAVEHEAGVPSATITLQKRSAKHGMNAQCVVARYGGGISSGLDEALKLIELLQAPPPPRRWSRTPSIIRTRRSKAKSRRRRRIACRRRRARIGRSSIGPRLAFDASDDKLAHRHADPLVQRITLQQRR
jgi:hypothetical protein